MNEKNKKRKKVSKQVEATLNEPTGSENVLDGGKITGADSVAEVKKVDRLDVGFPNEDLNKVVAKLNEVIEKLND